MSSSRTNNAERAYDNSDVAIRIENLGKCYQIYERPQDRLKQSIMPRLHSLALPLKRALGREAGNPPNYCREFWALKDASFEVKRGETVGIIGRNGSGKSTLLQLICRTLTPTSGAVEVNGRVAALLELGAGFNPEFTGRENVYMNGAVLGLRREEIDERFDDIVAFAEIGEFIEQPVKTYSSGMFMRLAFAVIVHVDADTLVIDEALAVGDVFFQQKCMRWLKQFRERGTILFCGHDTGAIMTLCNQAIWLDRGAIKAAGTAQEICEAYMGFIHATASGLPEDAIRHRPRKAAERNATAARPPKPESAAVSSTDPAPAKRHNSAATAALPSETPAVLAFNADSAAFGTDDAAIIDAGLVAADGSRLPWIEGGENITVVVRIRADRDIDSPFVGFHLKDRLGQVVLGDNTFLTYMERPLTVRAGQEITARFTFELPNLISGEYPVDVAIASGTLSHYVVHHWKHDAFVFRVHSPYRNGALIAIPMHAIVLEVSEATGVSNNLASENI